jgi:CHAD domain-containing protein
VAHRIKRKEAIGEALIRLAGEDLSGAQQDLRRPGSADKRIHRVRQRLKRVRTLVRAIEPSLGEQARHVRHELAATARLLAGARDADVAAASARGLASSTKAPEEIGLDRVVETLNREAAEAHRERLPVADVHRRLAALLMEVAALSTEAFDGSVVLQEALGRAYRAGRKTMRRARTSLATPDLHAWRKEVKHFWHLLRLARRRLGKHGRDLAPRLEDLGELLGLDHDHAVLAEKLALSPAGDPALMQQLSLIAERRRTLESAAFDLGGRIYRKPTGAFARRLSLK